MGNIFNENHLRKIEERKQKRSRKVGGAYYEWQDMAVRFAKDLGVKLNPAWFKVFKENSSAKLRGVYSAMIDMPQKPRDPERYFYKLLSLRG